MTAPRMPPTPNAADSTPTHPSPRPRSWSAITTSNTNSVPAISDCAANSPTSKRGPGSLATAPNPPSACAMNDGRSFASTSSSTSRGGSWIRRMRSADHKKVRAARMKTAAGPFAPKRTSTRPATAGPAKMPTLSMELETTFDAVSSCGLEARAGMMAACAGRNAVETTTPPAASAYTMAGLILRKIATAPSPTSTTRLRSEDAITSRREWRSPSTPMKGAAIAAGISRTRPTTPTAVAPPCSNANTDRAMP